MSFQPLFIKDGKIFISFRMKVGIAYEPLYVISGNQNVHFPIYRISVQFNIFELLFFLKGRGAYS